MIAVMPASPTVAGVIPVLAKKRLAQESSRRHSQRLRTLLARTVPPLPCRGWHVPQGRTSAPCSQRLSQRLRTLLAAAFTTPSRPAALLAVLLAVACSGPGSYEEFVRAEDAAGGVYEFVIPSSTVISSEAKEPATYDLSFYTAPLDEPLQLEITLDSLKETVWFPAGQYKALYRSGVRFEARRDSLAAADRYARQSPESFLSSPKEGSARKAHGDIRNACAPCRRHPQRSRTLPEAECWLRVRPIDPPEDFRGLGIIIKRNDGTR